MDFTLTDDQRMLREGVERLLTGTYSFAQRKAHIAEPEGWSRAQWRRFAEMGLLGLPFSAAEGGFDGGPAEIMLVMEAFGRALVVEPYLPTVLLAGGIVQAGGSDAQHAAIIPRIADGSLLLAFAQAEPGSRYDLAHVATTARRDGAGWILSGHKRHVLHGDSADMLVVSVRIAGETADPDGIALFLIDASSPGVSRRAYRLQDHTRAAEVWLENVRIGGESVIGEPGGAFPLIERVVDRACAALCCEAVGTMASALEQTLDYLKMRKQFGATLGSFQVLQHRAVDMFVSLELARSIAMNGIVASEDTDPAEAIWAEAIRAEASRAVSMTKVQIGQSARLIGQEAVQMHGGIGMTEDHAIGHYFRRLSMIEMLFGDTRHHLTKLATATE